MIITGDVILLVALSVMLGLCIGMLICGVSMGDKGTIATGAVSSLVLGFMVFALCYTIIDKAKHPTITSETPPVMDTTMVIRTSQPDTTIKVTYMFNPEKESND